MRLENYNVVTATPVVHQLGDIASYLVMLAQAGGWDEAYRKVDGPGDLLVAYQNEYDPFGKAISSLRAYTGADDNNDHAVSLRHAHPLQT